MTHSNQYYDYYSVYGCYRVVQYFVIKAIVLCSVLLFTECMWITSAVTSVFFHVAVDLPTDIEMSKVIADLDYVLADTCGLGDDADVNADDNVAVASNAVNEV